MVVSLDDAAPSLQSHYRAFITTTRVLRPCAPHRYSGARGGCPLARLPWHRDDRFPRSTSEPGSRSRHLYAGRRLGRKQVPPRLIPEVRTAPGFDVVHKISTLHRWFACARLLDPHLPGSCPDFCLDAHHNGFDRCNSRWFGACPCRPAPRGPPSSLMQHQTHPVRSVCSWHKERSLIVIAPY